MVKFALVASGVLLGLAIGVLIGSAAESETGGRECRSVAAPARAEIRVIEAGCVEHFAETFAFDDQHKCVIFNALPAGTRTVVCGNFRMEGIK